MAEEILCEARRQIRSIVSLCEEFGDRRFVQNLPARMIFYFFSAGAGAATTIVLSMRSVTLLSTSIRRVVSSTFFTTA